LLTGITEIVFQVTNCGKIFEVGSLLPIHGKITTSLASRDRAGPEHGSFKGTQSLNGNHPDETACYGSMANVSYRPAPFLSQKLMPFPFVAGAGKSVLWYVAFDFDFEKLTVSASSTIIEDIEAMRKSGLASLAMFYCDFREDQKKDLRGLLSSMLFQLCDQSDSYHVILSNFYSIHRDGAQSPIDDELARCLKGLLGLPGQAPVYLIIDALDECPNTSTMPSPREKVLALVVQLVESRHDNLHICITSRPETDIKGVLEPLTFHSVSIHDQSGQIEDIENYIKSVVDMDPRNRRWKAEDKQLVIEVLTARADGM
jgi:hypothetical protein